MNIFLNCLRKKAPRPLKHHQRPFSSYRLRPKTQTKHLDRPLRILDIVGSRRGTTTAGGRVCQNHLRLIQDLLRTDYRQTEASNAVGEVIDVVGHILEASAVDIEDPNNGFPVYDAGVLSNALSFCASTCDLKLGVQYHCAAVRSGFVANSYVGSCLITLYGKCAELDNAYMVFEEMPVKSVVSWTAIISGFAQELQVDVCLELYSMMRNSAMKPNDYTFLSLLSACTGSGALGQGRSAHCQVIRMGFNSYVHVANALISMYCKCGSLEDALNLFKTMDGKDVVSWNSMMAGYALHGFAMEAIELFENMKQEGVKPDAITFLGALSSCRHAGLVEQGRNYFNSMVEFGARPELDHYACLVDLLGRAGLIEEARDIIIRMPISPNAVIWGSLLSSCRLHGSVWVGIQAAESRLLLEPSCAATHVLLANLYASAKCWDQVSRVRKLMKDRGLRTNPGYSWIEIKNKLHTFRAEDKSNTRVPEILPVVDHLAEHMISSDYAPEVHEEVAFNF